MAVIESPTVAANLQEVGATSQSAAHVTLKPIPYGVLGHYRLSVRFTIIAAQAANSRLFSLRNSGTNLIIPTRLNIKWLQNAAHTAAIEDSLDCFKVTGFSVTDTVNTVTPTVSRKKTTMAAAPGNVEIRHVTIAGAAAGMTGGTLTKDGSPFAQLPKWLLLALPTGSEVKADVLDALDDVNGTHPLAFANNEGFIIENRVLLGAAAGSTGIVDLSYAEVTAY
jgi:hypothetical protein